VKREAIPGGMKGKTLEDFVRDSVGTYWHQTCTAKMGRDSMSVVDAELKVYGIEKPSHRRRLDYAARDDR